MNPSQNNSLLHMLLAVAAVPLIILFQGVHLSDPDYPDVLRAAATLTLPEHYSSKGYLVEGILYNIIGLSFLKLGLSDQATQLAWWGSGVAFMAACLAASVREDSLRWFDVLLIVFFTRLIDTLAMWIGKFDPYLIGLLVMASSKRQLQSTVGTALAALCNPVLATVSAFGLFAVRLAFGRNPGWHVLSLASADWRLV